MPTPFPPHVAKDVQEARALHELVKARGRPGALGHVQGERALARIEHAVMADPDHAARSRDAPEVTPGEKPVPRDIGDQP